jgi:hypothetical protein
MKKIRIDYYNYRLKKGRAEILLEKEEGTDKYFIPFHYVRADEYLGKDSLFFRTEDDGDLVINQTSLNKCTRRKKDEGWTSLDKLRGLSIQKDEYFHVFHNIYTFFLSLCPREGESGIRNRVSAMLESVKIDRAKKEYVESLADVLDGASVRGLGLYETEPDPALVRKEMETLEHFRIRKPNPIPMSMSDGYLLDNDLYGYECIDWEALGAKRNHRWNPSVINRLFGDDD